MLESNLKSLFIQKSDFIDNTVIIKVKMSYIDQLISLETDVASIIDDPNRSLDQWRNLRIRELHNLCIQNLTDADFLYNENLVQRHVQYYDDVIQQVWTELDSKIAVYQARCDAIIISIRRSGVNNISKIALLDVNI